MNALNPWGNTPKRSVIVFLVAVFFTFATIGFANDMINMGRQPPVRFALGVALSGFFSTPSPDVVLPWGSQSISNTCKSLAAKEAARLIAVVVFPTPPFWLLIAMIFPTVQMISRGVHTGNDCVFECSTWNIVRARNVPRGTSTQEKSSILAPR